MTGSTLLHLLPLHTYREANDRVGAPSLHTEGFLHCSPDLRTALAVANSRYREVDEPMVAVELDANALSAPIRWEAADPAPPEGVSPDVLFPHVYGPIESSAVSRVHYARRDVQGTYLDLEVRPDTAEQLDLLPHPEGGWYRRSWTSPVPVGSAESTRPTATSIHFLLPAGQSSAWHTVSSEELWFWHRGGVTVSLAGQGNRPDHEEETLRLGTAGGEHVQVVVPAGTWQRAEADSSSEALVSCVVSPGFDFADFTAL